jgi:hypothetical protein
MRAALIAGDTAASVASMLKVDPAHGAKVKAPKTRSHHTRIDVEIAQHRAFGLLERDRLAWIHR